MPIENVRTVGYVLASIYPPVELKGSSETSGSLPGYLVMVKTFVADANIDAVLKPALCIHGDLFKL